MYESGRGFKMRKVFNKNKLNSVVARGKKLLTDISATEIFILILVAILIAFLIIYISCRQEKFLNVIYGLFFVMVIILINETMRWSGVIETMRMKRWNKRK